MLDDMLWLETAREQTEANVFCILSERAVYRIWFENIILNQSGLIVIFL